ncbi:hypothetical protein [Bacillus sp. PK3_68]|uniref:hypothetical protein n=1 Tax=Bacillus sp. PK3_68 TaxID=2027408 RepID=UPI000E70880C|nr:hypothetical protein [Bacillus sp. PK3_68]RJS59766.1 hypothetical protein CJ483_06540 [Bacillus sp. PK3_68]
MDLSKEGAGSLLAAKRLQLDKKSGSSLFGPIGGWRPRQGGALWLRPRGRNRRTGWLLQLDKQKDRAVSLSLKDDLDRYFYFSKSGFSRGSRS